MVMRVKNKEIVCKWAKKKEIQKCLSERKKTWKSRNLCNERGVNHEVRGKAETLHCTDKYILVRKMDRTTYWGYSLSWYNLAGERRNGEIKRKERGERKGQEEKEREREKKDKREKKKTFYILQSTFCRQPSIALGPPSGDRLWVRITLFLHQSHKPSLLLPENPKAQQKTRLILGVYTVGEHNGDTSTFLMMVLTYTKFSLLGYEYIIKMLCVTENVNCVLGYTRFYLCGVLKYRASKI